MRSSSSIRSDISQLEANLKKVKRRLSTVNEVNSNLTGNYDDNITDFNIILSNSVDDLNDGIYKNSTVSSNIEKLSEYKENSDASDRYLSSAESSLNSEAAKLNSKIISMEGELQSLRRDLEDALEEERRERERERARREKAKSATK